eukprot:RCo031214
MAEDEPVGFDEMDDDELEAEIFQLQQQQPKGAQGNGSPSPPAVSEGLPPRKPLGGAGKPTGAGSGSAVSKAQEKATPEQLIRQLQEKEAELLQCRDRTSVVLGKRVDLG